MKLDLYRSKYESTAYLLAREGAELAALDLPTASNWVKLRGGLDWDRSPGRIGREALNRVASSGFYVFGESQDWPEHAAC